MKSTSSGSSSNLSTTESGDATTASMLDQPEHGNPGRHWMEQVGTLLAPIAVVLLQQLSQRAAQWLLKKSVPSDPAPKP